MKKIIVTTALICMTSFPAVAIDLGGALRNSGGDLLKAATIKEADVIKQSLSAVKYMDANQDSKAAGPKYRDRMAKIVSRVEFPKIEGVDFNVKVYKTEPGDLNAFATPDGSIRFHSALMDKMSDDELLAVLGHEIGHVVEKHSFKQMRKALITSAAIKGAASQSQVGADAYNIGGGDLANKFLNASFSKKDEISADKFALTVLKQADVSPRSMVDAIEVLKSEFGNGGGMMSSHPSNKKRIKRLEKAIAKAEKGK